MHYKVSLLKRNLLTRRLSWCYDILSTCCFWLFKFFFFHFNTYWCFRSIISNSWRERCILGWLILWLYMIPQFQNSSILREKGCSLRRGSQWIVHFHSWKTIYGDRPLSSVEWSWWLHDKGANDRDLDNNLNRLNRLIEFSNWNILEEPYKLLVNQWWLQYEVYPSYV